MEYDNVLLDAILWSLVIGGFAVWALVKERRHAERQQRLSDPISHVKLSGVDLKGRTLKVGVDVHSGLCVDGEGRVECVCGLAELEAEARGGAA